jgi:lipid-A-disaccharide synthase
MADVAVMGIGDALRHLPVILRRLYQTVAAARAFDPHALLIIDSPDFTHPIARRLRRALPAMPIIDYVSPTVWAWRPGRARKMAAYVDHLLALLPFEPEAHARLGGPPTTYIGHPIVERLAWIGGLDPADLAARLGLDPARPVVVVLPGSRRGVIGRMLPDLGATVRILAQRVPGLQIIVPTVEERRADIAAAVADWEGRPHIVTGEADKFAAFRLARAALATSGTVTLELAATGTPMVVCYRTGPLTYQIRHFVTATSIVLPNLVLGHNAFPEFIEKDVVPALLAERMLALIDDTPARAAQLNALATIAGKLAPPASSPSEAAADILLRYAREGRSAR